MRRILCCHLLPVRPVYVKPNTRDLRGYWWLTVRSHVSGRPWWQILLNVYLKEIYCLWWSVTCSMILTVWLVLSNGQRISHQFQGLEHRVLVHLFLLLANSRCKHGEGVHGRAGEEADVNMGKETTHHIFMSYERWCGQARLQGGLRRRRHNTC